MRGGPEKDPEPQQQRTMPQDHAGQLLGQGGEGGRRKAAGAQQDADQVRKAKSLHMGDKWVTKLQAEPEKKKTVTREWRVTV